MKDRALVALICSALALSSCGGRQPVEIGPDAQSVATRWNATLSAPPEMAGVSDTRGQGWMTADPKDPGQTRAHIEISNSVPNGTHPWHVHRGQCGADQGVFGPADAYKLLKVGDDGKASETATLPTPLPKSGSYFLNVHASAQNMSTIIACGNLAPPSR